MGVLAWAVIIGWILVFGFIYWAMGSRGWQVYYLWMTGLALYFALTSDSSVLVGMVLGWMVLPMGVGAAGGVFG